MNLRGTRGGRSARGLLLALVLTTTLGIAGCVSLPTTGSPDNTGSQNSGQGSDDQIWAQAPVLNESPEQIVDDFLQAAAAAASATGDASAQTTIARKYLTATALANWDPREISVYSSLSNVISTDTPTGSLGYYGFTGNQIGTVSDLGRYTVTPNTTAVTNFHVVTLRPGVNRIDWLPQGFGAALTQEEFAASYNNYSLDFLNRSAPATSMIPVPVYLRANASDHDQASVLARELFGGPGPLSSVADNALTAPTLKSLVIQSDGTAMVTVGNAAVCDDQPQDCGTLARQLLATFNGVNSISSVQVVSPSGALLGPPAQPPPTANPTDPGAVIAYYLGSNHQVYSLDGRLSDPGNPASIGPAASQYNQLAVGQITYGGSVAAMTSPDNTKLLLSTNPFAPAGPSSWSSVQTRYTGTYISGLSWDDFGGLWFTDTPAGGATEVYRLDESKPQATPQPVTVIGLPAGDSIKSVAVAPDGRRLAVVVEYPNPNTAGTVDDLIIGTAQQVGTTWTVNVGPNESQSAAQQWSSITQVAWRDGGVLGVLGSPQTGVANTVANTIYELRTDGSLVIDPATREQVSIEPLKYLVTFSWASGGVLLADNQVPAPAPTTTSGQPATATPTPTPAPSSSTDPENQNLLCMPSGGTNWEPRAIGTLGTLPAASF